MDPSWRSALNPAMIAPFLLRRDNRWGAPPGLYGVPVSGYLQLFLYRPDLFARARVAGDPQRWRWEDFLAAGRRLRAASVEPLVGAFHHRGHPALSQMYEQAHLGLSGLFATYRGEVPYRSPRWLGLFSQYVDLRQAGMGTSALALAPRPEAEAAFIAGKAAMLVDGPWFAGVQEQQAPRFAGWRVFFPPWGGHGATFLPAAPGGVADSLTINPRSPRRAQAARFLRWLTTRTEVQTTYANATWMLPASFAATQSPRLHPRLKPFAARLTDAATDLTIFESPSVNRVLYAGVLAVLRGEATPQAVLADADRAKRRGR